MIYRRDYLPNTDFHIYQANDMYHFNSDSELLGEFLKIKDNMTVLDIGCNNAVLMLYASRFKLKELVGVDLFQEVLDLASINLRINNVKADLYLSEIQSFKHEEFDIIVCNPPYFRTNKDNLKNENAYIKAARHEDYLSMTDLFTSVKRLLKDSGSFYYVHRPSELNRIEKELISQDMSIKTLQLVYDSNTKKARTILMEIVKSPCSKVEILPYIIR